MASPHKRLRRVWGPTCSASDERGRCRNPELDGQGLCFEHSQNGSRPRLPPGDPVRTPEGDYLPEEVALHRPSGAIIGDRKLPPATLRRCQYPGCLNNTPNHMCPTHLLLIQHILIDIQQCGASQQQLQLGMFAVHTDLAQRAAVFFRDACVISMVNRPDPTLPAPHPRDGWDGEEIDEAELERRYRDKTGPNVFAIKEDQPSRMAYRDLMTHRGAITFANSAPQADCNADLTGSIHYDGATEIEATETIRQGRAVTVFYGEEYRVDDLGWRRDPELLATPRLDGTGIVFAGPSLYNFRRCRGSTVRAPPAPPDRRPQAAPVASGVVACPIQTRVFDLDGIVAYYRAAGGGVLSQRRLPAARFMARRASGRDHWVSIVLSGMFHTETLGIQEWMDALLRHCGRRLVPLLRDRCSAAPSQWQPPFADAAPHHRQWYTDDNADLEFMALAASVARRPAIDDAEERGLWSRAIQVASDFSDLIGPTATQWNDALCEAYIQLLHFRHDWQWGQSALDRVDDASACLPLLMFLPAGSSGQYHHVNAARVRFIRRTVPIAQRMLHRHVFNEVRARTREVIATVCLLVEQGGSLSEIRCSLASDASKRTEIIRSRLLLEPLQTLCNQLYKTDSKTLHHTKNK